MPKAILVFDKMPNSCNECEVRCTGYTAKDYAEKGIKRPSWCPLRPLPNKWYDDGSTSFAMGIARGFNKCLDEITGETE